MPYQFPDSVLLIFCKAPIPGQVKTRLTPTLSPEQAAAVHRQLSRRTLDMATNSGLCPVHLYCSPSTDHVFFTESANCYQLTLQTQSGTDLGERMHQALCSSLEHFNHALLIGCDCPSLTSNDLKAALTALTQDHDLIIGPAEDGGYVLIGMNSPQPELFNRIPWGTPDVLQLTQRRAETLKLKSYQLARQWDVDTPADLQRWRHQKISFSTSCRDKGL